MKTDIDTNTAEVQKRINRLELHTETLPAARLVEALLKERDELAEAVVFLANSRARRLLDRK